LASSMTANSGGRRGCGKESGLGTELLQPMSISRSNLAAGSRRGSAGSRRLVKDQVRYKTQLCANWTASGKCPYGFKCQFAHGPEELRHRSEAKRADPQPPSAAPAAAGSGTASARPVPADRLLWTAVVSPSTPHSPSTPPTPPTRPITPAAPFFSRALPPQPPGVQPQPSPLQLPSSLQLQLPGPSYSLPAAQLPTACFPSPPPLPLLPAPSSALPSVLLPAAQIYSAAPHAVDLPAQQCLGGGSPFGAPTPSRLSATTTPVERHLTAKHLPPGASSERLSLRTDTLDLNRLSLEHSDESDRFDDDTDDDEASLRCNALTGEVEVELPVGRQVSHNTASVRRQISMLFE